jgi:DNA-binding MarR family transcriptional regulator
MNHVAFTEVVRLVSIVTSFANRLRLDFSETVDRVESALEAKVGPTPGAGEDLRATARALLRARSRQPELLGVDLFRDPAWDLLLDLYANGGEDGLMISALCHAACVPPTTALRYVHKLVETGSLVCEDDPQDQRRTLVRMAPHMSDRIEQVLGIVRKGG